MCPGKVNKGYHWGRARSSEATQSQIRREKLEKENVMDPWKLHVEGWSFQAKDLNVVSASKRRKRAFTGQLLMNKSTLPAHIHLKSRMIRMGIAIFIAADLFLAFIFLSSVL